MSCYHLLSEVRLDCPLYSATPHSGAGASLACNGKQQLLLCFSVMYKFHPHHNGRRPRGQQQHHQDAGSARQPCRRHHYQGIR